MMENLGKVYTYLPKKYRVCLLAAIANQGNTEKFRKYGFNIKSYHLSYARELHLKGEFKVENLRKNAIKNKEKKEKICKIKKIEILNFLSKKTERSSIPLPNSSFFYLFFNFMLIIKN
jgi:hypothetical protein